MASPKCISQYEPLPQEGSTSQHVTIFRFGLFRFPEIEGHAEIVAGVDGAPGVFLVRFNGEARIRERYVFGGSCQTEPEETLRKLQDDWRATFPRDLLDDAVPARLMLTARAEARHEYA